MAGNVTSRREIGRGAEAVVFRDGTSAIKARPKKGYRLDVIDNDLRKRRTKGEATILEKLARAGVRVPPLLRKGDDEIVMGFVEGRQVKDLLDSDVALAEEIGRIVAKVHGLDIIHGDLTTSNMIKGKEGICLIDFGLSYHSKRVEDKAVDLHLFLQALEIKHHRVKAQAWALFKGGYSSYPGADQVLKQLELVERRGRNKMKGDGA